MILAASILVGVACVFWAATYDADPLRDWHDAGIDL